MIIMIIITLSDSAAALASESQANISKVGSENFLHILAIIFMPTYFAYFLHIFSIFLDFFCIFFLKIDIHGVNAYFAYFLHISAYCCIFLIAYFCIYLGWCIS